MQQDRQPPYWLRRALQLAGLPGASDRGDQHLVPVDDHRNVLQRDHRDSRAVALDQHVAAIDELDAPAPAIAGLVAGRATRRACQLPMSDQTIETGTVAARSVFSIPHNGLIQPRSRRRPRDRDGRSAHPRGHDPPRAWRHRARRAVALQLVQEGACTKGEVAPVPAVILIGDDLPGGVEIRPFDKALDPEPLASRSSTAPTRDRDAPCR